MPIIDSGQGSNVFQGSVQGIVQGDHNTVTLVYHNGANRTVPFLAPPLSPHQFVGRDEVISSIIQKITSFEGGTSIALTGLPGVGKTSIALALVYSLPILSHFYDGILWAGLGMRGNVTAQLNQWSYALGIHSDEWIRLTDISDRAQAIRSLIGTKRILIVVDDAWTIRDALTFQIGGPNCVHLLTTRIPEIAYEFAGENTQEITELCNEDAISILANFAPNTVSNEPNAAAKLALSVGHLPFALVLVGRKLRIAERSKQPRRLHQTIEELKSVENRFRLEQPQSLSSRHPSFVEFESLTLANVISLSESILNERARKALHSLSIFEPKPNSFSEEAALAISDVSVEILDTIVDSGLLSIDVSGRYQLHQAICDFLRIQHHDVMDISRMVNFYISQGRVGMFDKPNMIIETTNVLSALEYALNTEKNSEYIELCHCLRSFFLLHGLYTEIENYLKRALQLISPDISDQKNAIEIEISLAQSLFHQGKIDESEKMHIKLLFNAKEFRYRDYEAIILQELGWISISRGEYQQGKDYYAQSKFIARKYGIYTAIPATLFGEAKSECEMGNYKMAVSLFDQSISEGYQQNTIEIVARAWADLGRSWFKQGDFKKASDCWGAGVDLTRSIGLRSLECYLINSLAVLDAKQGKWETAEEKWRSGLSLASQINYREQVCFHLMNMGWGKRLIGEHKASRKLLINAYELAQEISYPSNKSFILSNIAVLDAIEGNITQAKNAMDSSLSIAEFLGRVWLINEVLLMRGTALLAWDNAGAYYEFSKALQVASDWNHREHIAISHYGIALSQKATNEEMAIRLLDKSIIYFTEADHYLYHEAIRERDILKSIR